MPRKKKAPKKPKMRVNRAPKSSGWIKTNGVKFVTRNGRRMVLIRKVKARRKKR